MVKDIEIVHEMLDSIKSDFTYEKQDTTLGYQNIVYLDPNKKKVNFYFDKDGMLLDIQVYEQQRGGTPTKNPVPYHKKNYPHQTFIENFLFAKPIKFETNETNDQLCCASGSVIRIIKGWHKYYVDFEFIFGQLATIKTGELQ
jgi:hypothetical protein